MLNNEFYIGWMAKAPQVFVKHIRKVVFVLFLLAVGVGAILALKQKKFSTANFEFGKLTEVKGVYFSKPVPMIKVIDDKAGYITVPLVGYGKFGAETAIREYESEKNISLDNKLVTLKGTLLYSDGKTLLQVDKNDHPVVKAEGQASNDVLPVIKDLGTQTINGEIIDPKCYFGVMKPGEGKVHRDCAIRCILGGIPPVLHVQNDKGASNYYLLVGKNGEQMNEAVKDYVAEPVSIRARVVQQDDWIVLYVESIKR